MDQHLNSPDVSIIVPVRNTPLEYLKPCLNSIVNQTIPTQVLIVDDASDEFTYSFLKNYVRNKPNWTLMRHVFNHGVAFSRNTGLMRVKTPYVAFCDSDDIWEPNKLEIQLQNLYYGGSVDICNTLIDYRTESGYKHSTKIAPDHLLQELKFNEDSEFFEQKQPIRTAYVKLIRFNASFCGSNAVFKTNHLKLVGGFNPKLNGADEWDALLKVASRYPVSVSTQVLCSYVRHGGSFSTTKLEYLRQVCEKIIYNHRCNLTDQERVLLQSVETAKWGVEFERTTFAPNTPYKIIRYTG
jgi:glycosyltransferase involved in cell wall biosynthesis